MIEEMIEFIKANFPTVKKLFITGGGAYKYN
jgi:hypothetical protein